MNARRKSGQSTIVLTMLISIFVLLAIGLFSFEINRLEVARQQLRSACESASLAGAATLASSDETDTMVAHQTAVQTALNTFQENSIVGLPLSQATITYSNPHNPSAKQSSLYIEFLDPNNNNSVVSMGDPKGKTVRVTANFGLLPVFGTFLNLKNVVLHETSSGGVPSLDVALCFDISGSIDDQTLVTFVKRVWNGTTNRIDYTIARCKAGAAAGTLAEGPLFDIIGPPATGSALNALPPQVLSASTQTGSGHTHGLPFSEEGGRTGSAPGLRGRSNTGYPPGNFPGSMGNGAGTGNNNTFTDVVVNIDGQRHFAGCVAGGYNFPDLATVVEAARGNLDTANDFNNSRANLSVPNTVRPRAGYKQAYLTAAAANLRPLRDAQDACQQFLTIMNNNTDAHFSLVTFTSTAGTSQTSTYRDEIIDAYYNAAGGGSANYPLPMVAMSSATNATNYQTCYNWLPQTTATSGTNIGDAVNTALQQIRNNGRQGSKKAIVLFTDGQPTAAGPLDNTDPWNNARRAAVACRNAGVPLYCIGLAQNPQIIPGEVAILNDTNANTSTGGCAAIAGNGGKFFLVTRASDLRLTFENIARQLVQLVK